MRIGLAIDASTGRAGSELTWDLTDLYAGTGDPLLAKDLVAVFSSYNLTVIPLFVLMGQIAFHTGQAQEALGLADDAPRTGVAITHFVVGWFNPVEDQPDHVAVLDALARAFEERLNDGREGDARRDRLAGLDDPEGRIGDAVIREDFLGPRLVEAEAQGQGVRPRVRQVENFAHRRNVGFAVGPDETL